MEHDFIPCAIYNTDKKEIVGLFKTRAYASKYIFGFKNNVTIKYIISAITDKKNLTPKITQLPYKIAIRNLTETQKLTLGEADFVILNNYEKPLIKYK